MPVRQVAITNLTSEDGLRLLAEHDVGRLIVSVGALPVALLVNYWLVDDQIVFCASTGGGLGAATDQTVVGFEVDDIDRIARTGWRVAIIGIAHHVVDPARLAQLDGLGLHSWLLEPSVDHPNDTASNEQYYVAIDIKKVSGRHFGARPAALSRP